jgi:hypothetical protein
VATDEQLTFAKKLDEAILPDGSVYVARKQGGAAEPSSTEKRRATASGLAAALSRMKRQDTDE